MTSAWGKLLRRLNTFLAAGAAVAVLAVVALRWSSESAIHSAGPLAESPEEVPEVLGEAATENWVGARGGGALTGAVPRLYPRYERSWSSVQETGSLSGPVVVGARVYAGTDRGEIIGWSLATGIEEVRIPTRFGPIEAPLLAFQGDLLAGSLEGHFFRIDPRQKSIVWQRLGEAEIHGGANLVDTAAGPLVVWGDYRNNVTAVSAMTGEERWQHVASSYVNGTPSTDGERVVVGSCDARLYILGAADGEMLHRFDTGAYVPNSPALVDGVAYATNYDGVVVAVTLATGLERWRTEIGPKGLMASPSVAAGKVLVAFENGTLVALNQTNGEILWRQPTSGGYQAGILTDGTRLLAAGVDGRIRIHDVDSGSPEWSEQAGGAISVSPAAVGRRLIVVTEAGELVVFSALPESP